MQRPKADQCPSLHSYVAYKFLGNCTYTWAFMDCAVIS